MPEWVLIHQKDQGGCGGVAFRMDTDPQDMQHPLRCKTKCWNCKAALTPSNYRLRNWEQIGGSDD